MNEIELISASDAHKMTDEARENDLESLKPILKKISEAAKKKQYNCYINGSTPDYIIKKLHSLGYKTNYIKGDFRDPREQDLYEIHW